MKRLFSVLAPVILAPMLMGAGGPNPPPMGSKVKGPSVSAHIVIDPHNPEVTISAGEGAIQLQRGNNSAGAVFIAPGDFPLAFGCVITCSAGDSCLLPNGTNLTRRRFEGELTRFLDGVVVDALFDKLGILIDGSKVPVITDVSNATCTTGIPSADDPTDGSDPGVLSFDAVIQFLVPASQNPNN